MNKAELVSKEAELADITKTDADKAIEAVVAAITASLKPSAGVCPRVLM